MMLKVITMTRWSDHNDDHDSNHDNGAVDYDDDGNSTMSSGMWTGELY